MAGETDSLLRGSDADPATHQWVAGSILGKILPFLSRVGRAVTILGTKAAWSTSMAVRDRARCSVTLHEVPTSWLSTTYEIFHEAAPLAQQHLPPLVEHGSDSST
jgi:hypothetical protein